MNIPVVAIDPFVVKVAISTSIKLIHPLNIEAMADTFVNDALIVNFLRDDAPWNIFEHCDIAALELNVIRSRALLFVNILVVVIAAGILIVKFETSKLLQSVNIDDAFCMFVNVRVPTDCRLVHPLNKFNAPFAPTDDKFIAGTELSDPHPLNMFETEVAFDVFKFDGTSSSDPHPLNVPLYDVTPVILLKTGGYINDEQPENAESKVVGLFRFMFLRSRIAEQDENILCASRFAPNVKEPRLTNEKQFANIALAFVILLAVNDGISFNEAHPLNISPAFVMLLNALFLNTRDCRFVKFANSDDPNVLSYVTNSILSQIRNDIPVLVAPKLNAPVGFLL